MYAIYTCELNKQYYHEFMSHFGVHIFKTNIIITHYFLSHYAIVQMDLLF